MDQEHDITEIGTTVAVMANDIRHIQTDITSIKETMRGTFVTVERHNSLAEQVSLHRKILFGMIAVILVAFLTAIVNFLLPGS